MRMDESLRLFVSGDERALYRLTLRLFEHGFFNCYLTNQQFQLLSLILHLKGDRLRSVWSAFVEGSLCLKFSTPQPPEEEQTEKPEGTPQEINTEHMETELFLKPGKKSALHLASTIRYLLWEKAVDHLYNGGSDKDLLDLDEEEGVVEKPEEEQNPKPATARDEEDDYDDEEEEDKKEDGVPEDQSAEDSDDGVFVTELEDFVEVTIPTPLLTAKPEMPVPVEPTNSTDEAVGKIMHPLLGTASVIESNMERQNETKLIKSFNKIYHGFESDQQNLIKRRKLERSDKQLARSDSEDEDGQKGENVNKLINFGGAANLSLKNLLNKIEDNRDTLNITDIELRNLIMDVRKNRSKWASYNHIGQEELYEACEKVVLELRGYTEHSTAFLNKVSKRDAPNYYQIIKKPMDLNTVMKKLKTFQYKKKSEFVDDLMLIWKNCLTYNSDPNHFLRVDAIAMQKKTLSLIPLIPDITIRDRSEVEKEEMLENHEETPAVGTPKTTRVAGSKAPKKGRRQGHGPPQINDDDDDDYMEVDENGNGTATPEIDVKVEPTEPEAEKTLEEPETKPEEAEQSEQAEQAEQTEKTEKTEKTETAEKADNEEDDEDDEDDESRAEGDDNQSVEEDDLEMQTWKSLTANTRFKLCNRRSVLFKDNKLQPNEEAIVRDVQQMTNFTKYLGDESHLVLHRHQYLDDNDDPYLIEYDIGGGVPSIPYKGLSEEDLEQKDNEALEKILKTGGDFNSLPSSRFTSASPRKNILLQNIDLMQDIRKVCFKISLIRQMQTQQFLHHTQMVPPETNRIEDKDIEPSEKLGNHDYMNGEVCYAALKRNVCKITMASGFEATTESAADVMAQLASDYLSNLVRTLKLHLESNSINKLPIKGHKKPMTLKKALLMTLLENGVEKPDALYTYYRESVQKQHEKLLELKDRLSNFLKDLLRPGLQEFTDKQFTDSSDQFVTGDFSNEIGEDFFGFKELGLDKEFGLLTSTIPLHLLHSRLQNSLNPDAQAQKTKNEDLEDVIYPKLTKQSAKAQIGLMQPLLAKVVERSEQILLKTLRRNEEPEVLPEDESQIPLVEDDELPQKQRNVRPKIPPTGKIVGVRKKQVATAFFLEEPHETIEV